MWESIIALGMSILSFLAGGQIEPNPGSLVDWSCNQAVWTDAPRVEDGKFKGTIAVDCTFIGVSGGGFPELNDYLNYKVSRSPEVRTVHAGPIDETYANLPSTYYDVTMNMNVQNTDVQVREDAHIATDRQSQLVFANFSKDIQGSGNAQYLKKLDAVLNITGEMTTRTYQIHAVNTLHIKKPWYAPEGQFLSEIKKSIMKHIHQVEETIITEIANHI